MLASVPVRSSDAKWQVAICILLGKWQLLQAEHVAFHKKSDKKRCRIAAIFRQLMTALLAKYLRYCWMSFCQLSPERSRGKFQTGREPCRIWRWWTSVISKPTWSPMACFGWFWCPVGLVGSWPNTIYTWLVGIFLPAGFFAGLCGFDSFTLGLRCLWWELIVSLVNSQNQ